MDFGRSDRARLDQLEREHAEREQASLDAQAERANLPTRRDHNGEPLEEAAFYCPGCGRRSDYQKECRGSDVAPHPPIEVVSTDELSGDPANHTPAPASEGI